MNQTFTFLRTLLLTCSFITGNVLFAQVPGSVDPTFTTMPGPYWGGSTTCAVVQPDGKILIGGPFHSYDNEPYSYLARANGNGTLDTSFDTQMALDGSVDDIILLPDGKILISGSFTTYNEVSRKGIARLNADGTLDATFDPGEGAGHIVNCMVMQPDGKIIIGGNFNTYDGVNRSKLARLNADGSLDTTFDPGTGADNSVHALALQPDGKILVGGLFDNFNEVSTKSLVRLNANGSIDNTFDVGEGGLGILSVVLQPDDKILIGGFFATFNGVARGRIARLNDDGTVDTSFDPGSGASHIVLCIGLLPDGKVLTGGQFNNFNSISVNYLVSLNADGSLDDTFDFGTGPDGWVHGIFPQSNGKIFMCGEFDSFNSNSRNYIARLHGSCNTEAPEGEESQVITAGSASEATLEDLEVSGTEIRWYDSNGNLLPSGTQLINGATYYASQTIDGCESPYFPVTVEILLGLNQNTDVSFEYYPNPVKEVLHIVSDNTINEIEIYTMQGQKIAVQTWNSTNGNFDMASLANAVYLVKIYAADTVSSFMIAKSN